MTSLHEKTFIDYYNFLNPELILQNKELPSENTNIIASTPNPLKTQKIKNKNLLRIIKNLETTDLESKKEQEKIIREKEIEILKNDQKKIKIEKIKKDKNNYDDFVIENEKLENLLKKKKIELNKILEEGKNKKIKENQILLENRYLELKKNKDFLENLEKRILNENEKKILLGKNLGDLINEFLDKEEILDNLFLENEKNKIKDEKFLINSFLLSMENFRLQTLFKDLSDEKHKMIDIIKKLKDIS